MALTQIFLALAVSAAAAAPMGLSNTYLPPPPSPPPETYLPPTTPSPPPETYLPPTTPSPEYLPPPPSNEYLPPPEKEYLPPPADDLGQAEGGIIADAPVDNSLSELSGQDGGQDGGESAGGQSAGGQSVGGAGNFDDGQYHPEQYNSGKYDPNAGKFTGDDGQYHPEKIEFPPIEDFEFAYAVKDKDSGNDFGLSETNKGGVYRVLLPDGRIQIVQFVIDSRGIYRSRITYLQPEDSQ
ncbi:pre-mRNA-splicing ATP-dependent RNA helicase prp28-like isoform X1 [Amphibalanus amphitrite]|uniref:pre-mRNA-splicing ATP-dependent RNA helicase prp28-like isoform X1 n=2 Tax=Amphibalanus amphitrite TaxID=1232801 RepID=UPI001C909BBB|nr:pre-mRNA-splicing ATP-dependent RNA helicase prp28-like isoform X1 [Amphibalanus amphitrite]